MSKSINVATTYKVRLSPVYIEYTGDNLYFEEIEKFIKFCKQTFPSYWQKNDYDEIPDIIEIDKTDIINYLEDWWNEEAPKPKYGDELNQMYLISDTNNNFIHIELI